MYRTTEEINAAIKKCIYDLFEVALFDGEISPDEQAILDQVKIDFEKLEDQLVSMLKSDLDESEFQIIMNDFLKNSAQNALNIAKEDDLVTLDEQFLINSIQDFVRDIGAM